MQHLDNIAENLQKLADIKKRNPSATHIYMRRCDKDNLVVDIPIGQAEFTIRNRPLWELVASNKQMDDEVEALFKDPAPEAPQEEEVVVPPKPSEEVPPPAAPVAPPPVAPVSGNPTDVKCPDCDYVAHGRTINIAKNTLRLHAKKHAKR